MAIVAGPPSTGKTSVLLHALGQLGSCGPVGADGVGGAASVAETGDAPAVGAPASPRVAVVKFDCLATGDVEAFRARGFDAAGGLSAGQCPDHFFASGAQDAFAWAAARGNDLLVTESAGLCNRCSPYIAGVPAVCVVDCLAGMDAPRKFGPLLRMADVVVVTKGDLVSQAEREVFAYRVQTLAPRARVLAANGLTGQGTLELARVLAAAPDREGLDGAELRFSTPSALCSYCLGEKRLGEEFRMGNVRRLVLP